MRLRDLMRAALLAVASLPIPALAASDDLGRLAAALAERWRLTDDAVLVADKATGGPLLCVAAVPESGDSVITERAASLLCRGRVATWTGAQRWVRVRGLTERAGVDALDQTVFLFAFSDASGPPDEEISRWLELSLGKAANNSAAVEVKRRIGERKP